MKTIITPSHPPLFNSPFQQSSAWLTKALDTDLTHFWMKGIKAVLSLLIMTILVGLAGGVLRIFMSLEAIVTAPLEQVFRQLIVDTLIILAIVEVFKTTVTYFSEGRVKVTFIVDTILVVMLTEIISKWFSEAHLDQWMILGGILVVLAIIRVVAVQWSPTRTEPFPECPSQRP
ncbi:MAG: phosphate-starvation-inducible PsiE family protein [Nitrospira sp.]|nr:phosphate-starvation-inducible PsiE family protein [Nitrospira sp.]HNP27410.1 phosphate-starvation-inducible PsiE family protein [Nitrospirales bacterium]